MLEIQVLTQADRFISHGDFNRDMSQINFIYINLNLTVLYGVHKTVG
jgi:hypothetical protein